MNYYFPENIDSYSTEAFLSQIENAQPEADTIIFTVCNGGDVELAFKIADKIKEKKLNTSAHYIVASAGLICYCAGLTRTAYTTAKFYFHEPVMPVYVETNVNETDLRKDADTLSQYSDVIASFIANETGANKQTINNLLHADGGKGSWITVEDAIDLNLVTDLISADAVVDEVLAQLAQLQNINTKGAKKMDEEKEQQEQQPTTEQVSNSAEPNPIETIRAELDVLTKKLNDVAEQIICLQKKQDVLEAELAKPKALIPPINPAIIEKVVETKKQPNTLKDWLETKINKL